ncbi:carboxy-S-adenosyl-L-methionine synthase CmoA [bacterium]
MKNTDRLYNKTIKNISNFNFDDKVANVFENMIQRSVPGYNLITHMTGVLAQNFVKPDTNCYDLGCSLGSSTLAILKNANKKNYKIIAVDNSEAMIKKCKKNIKQSNSNIPVEIILSNIEDIEIKKASFVLLNFTLQFLKPEKRLNLIKKIYNGMLPGALFILSEKISFQDKKEEEHQTKMYHMFKKSNGYNDLEISQKRTALENVLIRESLESHFNRLKKAGFSDYYLWFQCLNFCSMIAIK